MQYRRHKNISSSQSVTCLCNNQSKLFIKSGTLSNEINSISVLQFQGSKVHSGSLSQLSGIRVSVINDTWAFPIKTSLWPLLDNNI